MAQFGREVLPSLGKSIQLTADGRPEMKAGGISVDWSTITAVSADTTLDDGVVISNGEKYIRYGQVMCLIGGAEVETVEFTGGPTAGNAILTLPAAGGQDAQSTAPLAFNAAATDVAAALQALTRIGPNGASVTRAGAGSAGSPYVYTITYDRRLGDVPALTATHTFTGGTTPTVTVATTTPGTGSGLYGPYDSGASDGRQTLARGQCFLVNETVRQLDRASDYPPVLDGGRVFRDRLIITTGTNSLAAGPTVANFEAAFPRIVYA
jgi:hypothetical protein